MMQLSFMRHSFLWVFLEERRMAVQADGAASQGLLNFIFLDNFWPFPALHLLPFLVLIMLDNLAEKEGLAAENADKHTE
jgi:hypothetical protein